MKTAGDYGAGESQEKNATRYTMAQASLGGSARQCENCVVLLEDSIPTCLVYSRRTRNIGQGPL